MRQKGFIHILVIILLLLLVVGGAYYFGIKKSLKQGRINPYRTVEESNRSSQSATPSTVANPTKKPNLNGNTYTSETLGIEFDYATYLDNEKTIKALVAEQGNKIYVYASTIKDPTQGQFIEVFSKDA